MLVGEVVDESGEWIVWSWVLDLQDTPEESLLLDEHLCSHSSVTLS
jgi:hypothetical protein